MRGSSTYGLGFGCGNHAARAQCADRSCACFEHCDVCERPHRAALSDIRRQRRHGRFNSERARGDTPRCPADSAQQRHGDGTRGASTRQSIALSGPSASLLANFNGVSSRDSALTNFGAEFEPPDQGLCAGNGYVVEMVNSAYTVYKPDGTVVTGPFNVNGPFDEGLSEFTSDPRCHYDAATHTWYATILFINSAYTASRVDLAVNTSGDPTKAWTSYEINTTDTGGATGPRHAGCPCFGDQPTWASTLTTSTSPPTSSRSGASVQRCTGLRGRQA